MSHIVAADIGGTHTRVALYEPNSTPPIATVSTGFGGGGMMEICLLGGFREQRTDQDCLIHRTAERIGKQDINSLPTARHALWAATKWWTADRLTTAKPHLT